MWLFKSCPLDKYALSWARSISTNFEHGDNNIDEFVENYAGILENLNIPLKRKNIDKTKNKYGNMLLNFCKANQLFIVNSRIGDM
jgi:hypothetical protein